MVRVHGLLVPISLPPSLSLSLPLAPHLPHFSLPPDAITGVEKLLGCMSDVSGEVIANSLHALASVAEHPESKRVPFQLYTAHLHPCTYIPYLSCWWVRYIQVCWYR